MKPEDTEMEQPEEHELEKAAAFGVPSKPDAHETSPSSIDEELSFLNSLPVVQKPKPKQRGLDEHLEPEEKSEPVSLPVAEEVLDPAPPVISDSSLPEDVGSSPAVQEKPAQQAVKQQPKKKKVRRAQKSSSQIQREEKNRLQKEKAEAKKAEIRKRQQDANSEGQSSSQRKKAKNAPQKKSLFGRFKKD